ncbi:MAG: cation diffusion facilitator family transporter [Bacteroidales bacterium]|nr:cation diffusion facilitator family transporter [Bacteroidales bacterium]
MIQIHEDQLHQEQNREKDHKHAHEAGKNLALAFSLNFLFCIIELIGGFWTNSIAILSDALHDFGDSLSLGMAWYFQKVSKRKPDSKYTYGYKRFSTLSALLNSVVLLVGSVIVLYECILRLLNPVETNAKGMFVLSIVGVLVNGAAVFRLKKGSSLNERVISLHLLEDVLGWFAVLIGSVVMMFAHVPVLDPILSIGISFYILYHVYQNLKSVFRIILQAKPSDVDETAIRESLLNLPKVHDLHDLHLWTMDSEYMVLTVHLVVDGSMQKEEQKALRATAHQILKSMDINHSTIEIEYDSEHCEWCEDETEVPV